MSEQNVQVTQAIDSGMNGDAVEAAELFWANLPTGRKWTSLHTHEKALVCHTLARHRTRAEPDLVGRELQDGG